MSNVNKYIIDADNFSLRVVGQGREDIGVGSLEITDSDDVKKEHSFGFLNSHSCAMFKDAAEAFANGYTLTTNSKRILMATSFHRALIEEDPKYFINSYYVRKKAPATVSAHGFLGFYVYFYFGVRSGVITHKRTTFNHYLYDDLKESIGRSRKSYTQLKRIPSILKRANKHYKNYIKAHEKNKAVHN